MFGLVLARGLNEDSDMVLWSRAVATAILACIIARDRGCPRFFLAVKRSVFAGVVVGEGVLLTGGYLFAH